MKWLSQCWRITNRASQLYQPWDSFRGFSQLKFTDEVIKTTPVLVKLTFIVEMDKSIGEPSIGNGHIRTFYLSRRSEIMRMMTITFCTCPCCASFFYRALFTWSAYSIKKNMLWNYQGVQLKNIRRKSIWGSIQSWKQISRDCNEKKAINSLFQRHCELKNGNRIARYHNYLFPLRTVTEPSLYIRDP